ncbi:PA14 domain-containing protein [Lentzea waywayandensis]|uniref:PA14 domain-containing protein n=1 Tax=Lentzea waywayandensis TaxID=84724 RepID=UPI001FE52A26|nr:PA14 domain-containing protein [Lentzea waywayandensis]
MLAAALATSLTISLASAPAFAAPPAKSPAVDTTKLPVLKGQEVPAPPVAAADPKADFTPLSKRESSSFDPEKSKVTSRSMFVDEYTNPDGTKTIKQSTEPLNVKDAKGSWQPVDSTLVADTPTRRVKARQHPLKPTLAGKADDAALITVEYDGNKVSLAPEKPAKDKQVKVSDSKAEYTDVAADTDLQYEVTAGSVKETILLKKVPATSKWRFTLKTGALTPTVTEQGTVELRDAKGTPKIVMPPIVTWDSSGKAEETPPAQTGGTYTVEKAGQDWVLTVAVDEAWLKDPKRVYPVSVDPTFSFGVAYAESYKSDGYWCQMCSVQFGNSLDRGDKYWRSAIRFDYQPLYGQRIVGAKVDVTKKTGPLSPDKTWPAQLYHASAMDFNGLGGLLATGLVGQVGSLTGDSLVSFLQHIADIRHMATFMIVGAEQPGAWTYKDTVVTLTVDTGSAPPAPTLVGPADHSVITNTTPTLEVNPVSDPDGEQVRYCFTVATGADAKSGVVVDSGCLDTPKWTVPAGVLQDGVAYTWQAKAVSGATSRIPSAVFRLKVDQRIGNKGPAPDDTMGPISVNLANGNVTTSIKSPTFNTVGGEAGLSMTYNSQQQEQKGLRASYFPDLSNNGEISPQQEPVLVRTEPQVNVDWGDTSPFAPALPKDWFVARWEGFFQAPSTGDYQFAGVHDDRLRVWINGSSVYDQGCCSDVNWGVATSVKLTAGQRVPIKVELAEATGWAYLRLFTRTVDGTTVPSQIVPADWLHSSDLPALSKGWTLSADLDGTGSTFTEAKVTDQNVVLTDGSGAKHTWTKKTTGGYTPPEGEVGNLALDTAGRITLTYGTDVYAFNSAGKLESQASAVDTRKPAALQYVYDGSPSRLKEIKDPVSGRAHRLHYNRPGDDCYGGATPPPDAERLPPSQMLCRIVYWDGTQTKLFYYRGHLVAVEDPGREMTQFSVTTNGLLDGMREPRAADWVSQDHANRNTDASNYIVHYYDHTATKPIARTIYQPYTTHGEERGYHSYRYDTGTKTSFVDIAGLNPAIGFSRKVVYDDAFRLLSSTDATGRTTSQTWSVKDQLLTSTDAAGRVSTTLYDAQDRPTDNFGPGPASCFNGQELKPACADTVPHSKTAFDEGLNGLAVSFYDNKDMVGAPKVFQTGLAADGTFARNWGTDAPVAGIPADGSSLRATGDIVFPEAGNYKLRVVADDGVRVWIDDATVIDDWIDTGAKWREATVNSPSAGAAKKIRVEYYDLVSLAQLELHWTTPGGTQQVVPAANMKPKYGHTTSTTKGESLGLQPQISSSKFGENGLDAAYGLVTTTTQKGQAVKTTYEPSGTGYLRKIAETSPTGAQTTFAYYGDRETRDNPCTPEVEAINQGGLSKLTRSPAPATGVAREDEQIFDVSGRVVAQGSAGKWTCTVYDDRDRAVSVKHPANAAAGERVVTTNYAVNGDPLVSTVTDHNGTITTKTDMIGRVVEYTDVHGVRTETKYDRAGRTTTQKFNLPLNAAQVVSSTYDDAGRLLTSSLDGALLATSTYDAVGELKSVAYANGTSLSAMGKDGSGQTTSLTWKTKSGTEIPTTVTRTRGGTIVDETLNGFDAGVGGHNYVYDTAGRLTNAAVNGHVYTYDFSSSAADGCPAGTVGNAGLNTNRVKLIDQTATGTQTTNYCYDAADRLLATTGANAVSGIKYDDSGNTTEYTVNGSTTHLSWDTENRNIGARSVGADPAAVAYQRDSTNRIVRRGAEQGDQQKVLLYGHTADGDSADIVLGEDKKLLSRSISLPGGVLLTINGDTRSYDHPSVRGDIILTTDAAGNQVGQLRHYSPFGEPIATDGKVDPDAVPDNQPGQMDYGWLGQHQRPYEHAGALSLVQMGARPYSPLFGRFLAVDPVEGGSANDYDYVNGDPINANDIDGKCPPCLFLAVAGLRVGLPIMARFAVRKAIPWGIKWAPRIWGGMKAAGRSVVQAGSWLRSRTVSVVKRIGRSAVGDTIKRTIRYIPKNPRRVVLHCVPGGLFGGGLGAYGSWRNGNRSWGIPLAAGVAGCVGGVMKDAQPTNPF